MPVFGSLEAAGVILAIIKPETGFHVIKKSGSTGEGHADDGQNAPGGDPAEFAVDQVPIAA